MTTSLRIPALVVCWAIVTPALFGLFCFLLWVVGWELPLLLSLLNHIDGPWVGLLLALGGGFLISIYGGAAGTYGPSGPLFPATIPKLLQVLLLGLIGAGIVGLMNVAGEVMRRRTPLLGPLLLHSDPTPPRTFFASVAEEISTAVQLGIPLDNAGPYGFVGGLACIAVHLATLAFPLIGAVWFLISSCRKNRLLEQLPFRKFPAFSDWGIVVIVYAIFFASIGWYQTKIYYPKMMECVLWKQVKLEKKMGRDYVGHYSALGPAILFPNRSVCHYAAELRAIDVSSCPLDFQDSYLRYVEAWMELGNYIEANTGLNGIAKGLLTDGQGLLSTWLIVVPEKVRAVRNAERQLKDATAVHAPSLADQWSRDFVLLGPQVR